MKKLLLITVTIFLIQIINAQTTFDYFGQTPPGNTAVMFAPGIISLTNRLESQILYMPDGKELYMTIDGSVGPGKIYCKKYSNKSWSQEEEASFSKGHNTLSPFISADGKTMFFSYWNTDWSEASIYKAERTVNGWGDPLLLSSPVNSTSNDWDYRNTADEDIYFTSNRPGGSGSGDIWYIKHLSDQAMNMGTTINSSGFDAQPCISPDGSYLIFSSFRTGKIGEQDLFICFNKENDDWTVPINMEKSGAKINLANQHQGSPTISPDGKYLFFFRHNIEGTVSDIYWVSTNIIDTLKKIAFPTTVVNTPETENLISVFPNPSEGVFTITLASNLAKNATAEIFTMDGKIALRQTIWNKSGTIDMADYAKGIYILKITADSKIFTQKISLK
jgi:hypothetical protein